MNLLRSLRPGWSRPALVVARALSASFMLPLLLLACAPAAPEIDREDLAALLDAEDGRDPDSDAWAAWLADDDEAFRARAARSAGRLRRAALAPFVIERLATESAPAVRDELLFALGQMESPSARETLVEIARSRRAAERALALEALGKLGRDAPLDVVLAALDDAESLVRREALYALVRLRGRRVQPPPSFDGSDVDSILSRLDALTGDAAPDVRFAAAYALAETPLPGRRERLVMLTSSDDAYVRLFAARALGRLASSDRLAAAPLPGLIDDPNVHVAAAATASLGPVPGDGVREALEGAATRADVPAAFHVRAAAVSALAVRAETLPRPEQDGRELRSTLIEAMRDAAPTVRHAALLAAARADAAAPDTPRASGQRAAGAGDGTNAALSAHVESLVRDALEETSPWLRAAGARAAGHLSRAATESVLRRALGDADYRVATAALETIAALGKDSPFDPAALARSVLRPAEGDDLETVPRVTMRRDLAVRTTAIGILREHGDARDAPVVARILRDAEGDDAVELRLGALEALATFGGAESVSLLIEAARDPSQAVAAAASRLAAERGADPPPEPHPDARRSSVRLEIGTDVASRARNPRVTIHTAAGVVELELFREEAPRHVKSFVDLARRGVYDGLEMHRVVTGFVVQGLDPRGDGWGSGGVFLRDEINRTRYAAGTLGMPNAGPDTAGCQIFITHVPTPHLDGRYTVFGRVTRGMDVLDRIEVGQVVDRVTID